MDGNYCRMCGACERANPGGIAVSDILRFRGYAIGYGDIKSAQKMYAALPEESKIGTARNLDNYEKNCPYGLPVAKLLTESLRILT
jgi:predicted aldo/keto reductase-like oxidoreductase